VFRFERKADALDAALNSHWSGLATRRAIVDIVEVPTVPTRCIAVDSPSHLFLASRAMIPTHNTAFALGMATHAALEARRPVLFFSLEMSHLEITQRILSAEARVEATRMRNGKLAEADWTKLSHAIGRLAEAPLYIDDNPHATVMEIRAKARRLKSRVGDLGLIVIDYLQLMTGRSKAENRQVEVSEISRGLKILARELEVPVVALSQLSRNLELRADKRPMLADLRESGSLEQDADVVMFLYRDELYNNESADRGTAEVLVAKHRSGPTGMDRLAFLDHYTRFANMARNI
jgi:replicative DNA helicase